MTKTLFSILFSCIFFVPSSGQVKLTSKFFKVTDATVQTWSAGASQPNGKGQSGNIYQVKLTVTKANQARFDSLVVDGNVWPTETVKGSARNYSGTLAKGDQIIVLARTENGQLIKKPSPKITNAIATNKAKAFLCYSIKGKQCLFPITSFKEVSDQMKNQ